MKNLKRTLRAGAVVAGLMIAGSASASTIVDYIQPADPVAIGIGTPYSFTHDFTDNSSPNLYVPGYDTITAAGLLIVLTDRNGDESYTISFGTPSQTTSYTTNITGPTDFTLTVNTPSLTDLSNTGKLGVTITATNCNGADCGKNSSDNNAFQFVSSTLTAQDPPGIVPEPSSLLLLGLGLVGLGAIRGRMRSQ